MADYTKTITNALYLLGGDQTTRYGVAVYGTGTYGNRNDTLILGIGKLLANSFSLDSAISKLLYRVVTLSNSLTLSNDLTDETLYDSNGYKVNFGTSTNAENRPLTSYNNPSDITTSFTSSGRPSTSWSEVS